MLTWEAAKNYVLNGLLKDPDGTTYDPDQLLIYTRWALAELSQHTAEASCFSYDGDNITSVFRLPHDISDPIEKCGVVAWTVGSTGNIEYIAPYTRLPEIIWPANTMKNKKVFWEWPTGFITLGYPLPVGDKITIYYFKIWSSPKDPNQDDFEFNIPQWMEQPLCYLIAAAAQEPNATQFANIRNWNRRGDSGTPEDNVAQKRAKWFIEQAYRQLGRFAAQDKDTFYRIDPRTPQRS